MRFLSFFSGALGLDLGFEQAGWECLAANESDPAACETIRRNRPRLRLYACDIRSLRPAGLLSDLGLRPGGLDAVVGGPPCQAFSTAGRRGSMSDPRGSVAMGYLELAVALAPRWIVFENVRGLLSAPLRHRPHAVRGSGHPPLAPEESPGGALARVRDFLGAHGYSATWRLYDASFFGVAQRRERLVVVASREGPWPHLPASNEAHAAPTFREAASGVDSTEWLPLRAGQARFLQMVGPGQNWRSLDPRHWPEALGGAFRAGGGRVGFLRRVAWDRPAPTLVTDPTMPATLLAHPEEMRPLSVEEYKQVQGFPQGWDLAGPTAAKYRQLGNAVPVEFARQLAEHLASPKPANGLPTSRYRGDGEAEWLARHRARLAS